MTTNTGATALAQSIIANVLANEGVPVEAGSILPIDRPFEKLSGLDVQFKPIGDTVGCAPEAVLHGQLVMLGSAFHVTAIQVSVTEGGALSAVAPAYAEDLERVYELSGDSLSTTELNGLSYVVFVIPHAT